MGTDTVHTFTADGTFTPPSSVISVRYLVVGGGGGGGGVFDGSNLGGAGGGGAGGYQAGTGFAVTPSTVYNITVGGGGTAGVGNTSQGGTGGNSSFSTITANGGGGGASAGVNNNGVNGASGGGARITGNTGGTGTAGQGNNGGNGNNAAGGGGGSAAAGANGGATVGGAGGAGTSNNITGAAITYASGGAGGNYDGTRAAGVAGVANTGNGGGGASGNNGGNAFNGGAGGSGIVIIRYTTPVARYAVATGSWNVTSTWSATGCGGAAGASVPPAGADVVICGTRTVTLNADTANLGSLTIQSTGVLNIGNNNTARTVTVAGNLSNDGAMTVPTTSNISHALNVGGNIANNGTFDLASDADSLCNTTLTGGGTHTISGTGAMRFNNHTVNNNLIVNKSAGAITQSGIFTVNGNLDVQSGTLNLANASTVTGTSGISGTLNHTTTTGARNFTGAITINSGGTWSNTANHAVSMGNSLTNNGTFNSGTGLYTFQTTAGSVWAGTSGLSFGGAVTVNANRTNNTTLSVAGVLTIATAVTVTNNTTATVTGNIVGGGATTNWTNATNSTLNVAADVLTTGVLNASANNNTVHYNGTSNVAVKLPSGGNYFHLTISNTGTRTPAAGTYNVGGNLTINPGATVNVNTSDPVVNVTGDTTVDGTYIGSNTAALAMSGNLSIGGTFTGNGGAAGLAGNFTNNGTFTSGAGTFTFNGSAAQSLTGSTATTTFTNMALNNANGLALTGTHNATVSTLLTLTSGRITTNSNVLFISNGSAVGGAAATRFVVGNLRKAYTTGNQTRVFEVGTETGGVLYAPVTLQLGNVTAAGNFTVTTTAGDHPDIAGSTLDPVISINRYWTLTNNSVNFNPSASTTITFVYNNPADYDTGADFNQFYVGGYDGAWNEITPDTRTATSVVVSGTDFTTATLPGDYQIGQQQVPSLTCPSGQTFVSGLLGSYYDYTGQGASPPQPTGPATGTRVDGPVDFNWANAAPGVTGIAVDDFAVRWDGALHVTTTGTYQFQTVSDDGVRLWINEVLVIDNWTDHASTTNTSGNVQLIASKTYSVRLEFYENGGQAEIRLRWGPSGGPFTAIPAGPLPTLGDGLYYCQSTSPGASVVAYYKMDEDAWTGTAGEILDDSGNGNHASRIGAPDTANASPARTGDPGTCGYGTIPVTAGTQAVNTGLDVNTVLGNAGTITFWYSSNAAWNDANNRMLFDASNNLGNGGTDRHFYLVKESGGRLRFAFESSTDADYEARSPTPAYTFPAGEWHHIAVTWNMGSVARLYLDGSQVATSATTANNLGNTTTLYLGDQRGGNIQGTPGNYGATPANGSIDEVRIYASELSAAEVAADWLATHPCTDAPDHIRIEHDGEGLTCAPEQVTVRACADANCDTEYTGSVTTTLSPTGWVGGDTITFTGNTTAQLRHNIAETITLDAVGSTPSPASATRCFIGLTETCSMEFFESGFIFDVPTQTACRTSAAVTMTAVKTSDTGQACAPAFSGVRTVGFWSNYVNPGTGTQAVGVNGTPVGTASPGTGVSLTFDANAQATFTVNYPDAGQVQLNARYTGSGAEAGLVMTGNDQFVSVPVGLAVYASSDCPAGDASCPVFGIAGTAFPLNIKAACWVADGDTDLSDNPETPNFIMSGIPMNHTRVAPDPGADGAIGTNNFDIADADDGIATFNQSVSEVGVFTFTATPAANAYFGQTIPAGTSPYIGRFRPARYGVTFSDITPACTSTAPGFTYSRQPFAGSMTIEAQNSAGALTSNYRGGFVTLDPATELTFLNDETGAVYSNQSISFFQDFSAAPTGSAMLDLVFRWDMPLQAPADSTVRLTASTDEVNVIAGSPVDIGVTNVRYGRLFMENAFGSELLPLALPLYAEYYTGTQFVLNTDDGCTTYDSTDVTFANRVGLPANPAASGSGTLIGGRYDPNNPIMLGAPGAGNTGSIDAILNAPSYLHYDWTTDGNLDGVLDDDPFSKATFGIYGGPEDNQIYIREVY